MKYLILLSLIACSTPKEKTPVEETPERERIVIPTESEAKPVSPYTVQPCYCMKIFEPVCAKGQTYGNSCEAECQGNTTWSEGPCSKK